MLACLRRQRRLHRIPTSKNLPRTKDGVITCGICDSFTRLAPLILRLDIMLHLPDVGHLTPLRITGTKSRRDRVNGKDDLRKLPQEGFETVVGEKTMILEYRILLLICHR